MAANNENESLIDRMFILSRKQLSLISKLNITLLAQNFTYNLTLFYLLYLHVVLIFLIILSTCKTKSIILKKEGEIYSIAAGCDQTSISVGGRHVLLNSPGSMSRLSSPSAFCL